MVAAVLDGLLSVTPLTTVTEMMKLLSSSTGVVGLLVIVYPLREPLVSVTVNGGKGNGFSFLHSLTSKV